MSTISRLTVPFAIALLWCVSAWPAAQPRYHMRAPILIQPPGTESALQPLPSPARRGPTALPAYVSPGRSAGDTYYDAQHDGSMGRQSVYDGSRIQCAWTRGFVPSPEFIEGRWNRLNFAGPVEDFVLDNGDTLRRFPLMEAAIGGNPIVSATPTSYVDLNVRPDGRATVVYNEFEEITELYRWGASLDAAPGVGIFFGPSVAPGPPGAQYTDDAVLWPKSALSLCGSDTIMHAVGTWSGATTEVWYWRGTATWDSVYWDPGYPVLIDSMSAGISSVIAAYDDDVTIAMGRLNGTPNADVVTYRSTDCGLTWDPTPVNLTNYAPDDPEGFWAELAASYDEAGDLHVLFNTAPANGMTYPCNLWHHNPGWGAQLVAVGDWVNTCANGSIQQIAVNNGAGLNNLAIAEPTIAIKPAGAGGIADELIYAIWTQFGPTDNDCATVDAGGQQGGHVNGELYMSASSTGGLTWSLPKNLTGTITPDCLPDDCASEGWVSAAAVADSAAYIAYVEDTHAGPAVLGGGEWTESPYMVVAFATEESAPQPVIVVSPMQFVELNAKPGGGVETVTCDVINAGNAALTYMLTVTPDGGGQSHVLINGGISYNNFIPAGSPPEQVSITFDALGLVDPSEHLWRIEVTSNDPSNDPGQGGSARYIDLQVIAADTWYTCDADTVSTGLHRLRLSSCLELGDWTLPGTGFLNLMDGSEWLLSGSPVLTRLSSTNDTLVYRNVFLTNSDRTRAENKSFRAQSPLNIARDSTVTLGDSTYVADVVWGSASTTDSTIAIDYETLLFDHPALERGAIFRLSMTNPTGTSIDGLSYGTLVDLDVDDDAFANAGIGDETQGYIGVQGGYFDSGGVGFVPVSNYMAIFHLSHSPDCANDGAVGAQVLANSEYLHPQGTFRTDSLYTLVDDVGALATWDANIRGGTEPHGDVSALMVSGSLVDLVPFDTVTWGYGLAVSDLSIADLEATISALREAAIPECVDTCLTCGDFTQDGHIDVGDLIGIVNYLFRDGSPPADPDCADADDHQNLTIRDLFLLLDFLFRQGPQPICPPANPPFVAAPNDSCFYAHSLVFPANETNHTIRLDAMSLIPAASMVLPARIRVGGAVPVIDSVRVRAPFGGGQIRDTGTVLFWPIWSWDQPAPVYMPPKIAHDLATLYLSMAASGSDRDITIEWMNMSPSHTPMVLDDQADAWEPNLTDCLIERTGDVNLDTTINSSDIIYLVNFVFKGGDTPLPCEASGDVNWGDYFNNCAVTPGAGFVTSADIIYLVGYVFKGGPPPCDVCMIIPDIWTCP